MTYKDYQYSNISITFDDSIMNSPASTSVYVTDSTSAGGTGTFTITSPTTGADPYNYNWTIGDTITLGDYSNITNNGLHVNGDANFEGDVKIKGKSLVESLEKIEEKLAILRPNEQLEEKWDKLRELRKQYMELEAEIIEKEKIWNILKK